MRALLVVLLALGVVIGASPASAQAPMPTAVPDPEATASIAVTPDTGLVDEQAVFVEGTGFPADTELFVSECSVGASPRCASVSLADPGFLGSIRTDASGEFSGEAVVQAVIESSDGTTIDCRPAAASCILQAKEIPGPGAVLAAAAIAFDPDAPLGSPATLTVTPSTNLRDGQFVQVEGTGFDPDGHWNIEYCQGVTAPRGPCRLIFIEHVPVDAAGEAAADIRLPATIELRDETIDCRTAACSLTMIDGAHVANAPVSFAPAPAAPVTVTPAFTG